MKLLVISDTHGRLSFARSAIRRLKDSVLAVIHLGDMVSDAVALAAENEGLIFHYVAGNCDYYYSCDEELKPSEILTYNGVRILAAHGHNDGVKSGCSRICGSADREGAKVVLFGHTHEPHNSVIGGVLAVNPGSASMPRGRARYPSYAVLNIGEGGEVSASVIEIR